MERFDILLEKRKNMTTNIFEEEELIELSKSMSDEDLKYIDKSLLTYTNSQRIDSIISKIDELISKL